VTARVKLSVVTPFRNTERYLGQCIESVLNQGYSDFEYILSDNCSTDGSWDLAESYAQRDSRIRLIRQPRFLGQVQHYNSALREISSASEFCKIVQADDWIFKDCLSAMVQAFEQSSTIGLVSAYDLKFNQVRGSGFSYPSPVVPGKEMARIYLRGGPHVFGSPTTVMYRSRLVRATPDFFSEGLLHEDTEKCLQILADWDFSFVHQVLSFLRADNESISSGVRDFQPNSLDRYIIVTRYAEKFLDQNEAAKLRKSARREYYRVLAREALLLRDDEFWTYHKDGLKTIGETISGRYLATQILGQIIWLGLNPGTTIESIVRRCNRHATQ